MSHLVDSSDDIRGVLDTLNQAVNELSPEEAKALDELVGNSTAAATIPIKAAEHMRNRRLFRFSLLAELHELTTNQSDEEEEEEEEEEEIEEEEQEEEIEEELKRDVSDIDGDDEEKFMVDIAT